MKNRLPWNPKKICRCGHGADCHLKKPASHPCEHRSIDRCRGFTVIAGKR